MVYSYILAFNLAYLKNPKNDQGDIQALLEKDCEVEKMIKFLREIGLIGEI